MKNNVYPEIVSAVAIAFLLVLLSFIFQANIGINLADEGFLWYGSQRTAIGEIPLRDFQSYDPGRYYWNAFWFKVFGNDSIMTLRLSCAIFQFIGLTLGVLALGKVVHSRLMLVFSGALLLLWMYPRHKLFEFSIAMAAVYFAVLLIEKPTIKRYLISGIFVGLAAFFGRNHGIYTLISFSIVILYIKLRIDASDFFRRILAWSGGILAGYSPMLFMLIFIPGLKEVFFERVFAVFQRGSTNLPLPVPWPWSFDYAHMDAIGRISSFSQGMLFLLLPVLMISIFIYLLLDKKSMFINKNPVILGSVFTGIPYMHYAFARADIGHLAHSIHPFLIALITIPFLAANKKIKVVGITIVVAVVIFTFFSLGRYMPFYMKATSSSPYIQVDITGDKIWTDTGTENVIKDMRTINEKISTNEKLFIAPHLPGFYPILERKSPVHDIYILFPEKDIRKQEQMIKDLKDVRWTILGDIALDGREELRFKNTHKLVWEYIMSNYKPISTEGLPQNYQIFHR